MESLPSVRVSPVEGYHNAYWLQWDSVVKEMDIAPAFQKLTKLLDDASGLVYVIVDLRANPNMPVAATMQETMAGPFRHENMGEWIVIGQNWRAEMIANVITKVGLRTNITWVKTEEEAFAKLDDLTKRSER